MYHTPILTQNHKGGVIPTPPPPSLLNQNSSIGKGLKVILKLVLAHSYDTRV